MRGNRPLVWPFQRGPHDLTQAGRGCRSQSEGTGVKGRRAERGREPQDGSVEGTRQTRKHTENADKKEGELGKSEGGTAAEPLPCHRISPQRSSGEKKNQTEAEILAGDGMILAALESALTSLLARLLKFISAVKHLSRKGFWKSERMRAAPATRKPSALSEGAAGALKRILRRGHSRLRPGPPRALRPGGGPASRSASGARGSVSRASQQRVFCNF